MEDGQRQSIGADFLAVRRTYPPFGRPDSGPPRRQHRNGRDVERFKGAISGSGVRGSKVEDFIAELSKAEDPLAAWHEALDELERIVTAVRDDAEWDEPAEPLKSFRRSDLTNIATKVSSEDILELSLIAPRDVPTFEYQTKELEYIAFADASAGQQATALLHVLLSQDGPPLLIDQPEDDLDSQVVLELSTRPGMQKAGVS